MAGHSLDLRMLKNGVGRPTYGIPPTSTHQRSAPTASGVGKPILARKVNERNKLRTLKDAQQLARAGNEWTSQVYATSLRTMFMQDLD